MNHPFRIVAIGNLPEITCEANVRFGDQPGSFLWFVEQVGKIWLHQDHSPERKAEALLAAIRDLDMGEQSALSNEFAAQEARRQQGQSHILCDWHSMESIYRLLSLNSPQYRTFEAFAGYTMRKELRDIAMRFFLYYTAGYRIEFNY